MIVSHENRDLGTFTKLSNRMSHIVDFTALLLPPGGLEAPEFFFHTMGGHLFHENDGKIPPPTVSCVLTNAGDSQPDNSRLFWGVAKLSLILSRIDTAYIGFHTSILGTWNLWWKHTFGQFFREPDDDRCGNRVKSWWIKTFLRCDWLETPLVRWLMQIRLLNTGHYTQWWWWCKWWSHEKIYIYIPGFCLLCVKCGAKQNNSKR